MQYGSVKDAAPYGGGDTKGRRPPPVMGGDGGLRLCRELRHLRMALWDDWGVRAVRGAGVSLAAASGYFARCDGRPEALPLDSAIF